jgi:hypothetical protein
LGLIFRGAGVFLRFLFPLVGGTFPLVGGTATLVGTVALVGGTVALVGGTLVGGATHLNY